MWRFHPLRPIMLAVWWLLEPFAKSLTQHEIWDYAQEPHKFEWRKKTMFMGLYQKTVAISHT